ncbi:hypothetical protein CEXT_343881 [Caerostris extrusa]|uniref:Uncharacterized protein n=1 Tax=Caerostris extrusa TaxID=172846 RepID=A0AAV4UV07_CAEEX|nr:hypothetical protein CEXT_343881 [Caerostris extrusa]
MGKRITGFSEYILLPKPCLFLKRSIHPLEAVNCGIPNSKAIIFACSLMITLLIGSYVLPCQSTSPALSSKSWYGEALEFFFSGRRTALVMWSSVWPLV